MLRSTVALALTAVAYGQVEVTSETTGAGNQRLMARRQVVTDITDFESRINVNLERAVASAQIDAERAAYNATTAATATMYNTMNNEINQLRAAQASSQARLDAQMSSLTVTIENTLSAATASMNSQMAEILASTSNQLSAAAVASDAGISRATAAAAAGVASNAACNAQGQYYNGTVCLPFSPVLARNTATSCSAAGHVKVHPTSGKLEVCDGRTYKATLPAVTHRGFTSSQGCENCYTPHRDVVVVKHYSDTYLRVVWHDNTRNWGWNGRHNQWHVRVCDANGNGCADCNDPGKMMTDKYTWAEHGWRNNLHYPTHMTALCRRTTNRQLNAGRYKIRIWVANGNDAYTGHGGQYGSLQVEEVYKV